MNAKTAQASMEYVMIAGFVALVIIPTAFIFYRYAADSAEEIDQAQIEKFGRDVVSTAETVYYLGAPSRIVLDERLPKNIQSISIDKDAASGTYLFAIAANAQSGTTNLTFPTSVRIQGFFTGNDINPGQKEVWIIAQKDADGRPYVDLRFGNWRRIFVTSATYPSNSGLAGADASCQAAAQSAGLGGVWNAWLSTGSTPAKDRIGDHVYTLVNQTIVVAESKADLLDSSLENKIDMDELGNRDIAASVWTGTLQDGRASPDTCADWSGAGSAVTGSTTSSTGSWTESATSACGGSSRLYCFEK